VSLRRHLIGYTASFAGRWSGPPQQRAARP
jgi:hypothetical protein